MVWVWAWCGVGGGGATVYLVHGLLDLAQADVQVHLLLLQLAALLVEQVGVVVDEVQVVARRDGHGARATLRQPVVGLRRGRREKECNNNNNTFYLRVPFKATKDAAQSGINSNNTQANRLINKRGNFKWYKSIKQLH